MTDHLTPADFAAVPWGGRAIPPKGSEWVDAARVPEDRADPYAWMLFNGEDAYNSETDADMARLGWTLPAPADPWDVLSDALQAAWDTGEERDGEAGETHVHMRTDGYLESGVVLSSLDEVIPGYRFRPRPRPSWQDAEVVEATTEDCSARRRFWRMDARQARYWMDTREFRYKDSDLIDPVPMTVQKKEER